MTTEKMYIIPKGLIHEFSDGTIYEYNEKMQVVSESYPANKKRLYCPDGTLHIEFFALWHSAFIS